MLVLTAALTVGMALPAAATPPSDLVITNLIDDNFGATTFDATSDIVCSTGEVEGEFINAAGQSGQGVNLTILKTFTCDDGEFVLKLQVRLRFDGSGTTFNWNVVSGTGAYENLHGAGRGIGTPVEDGVLDTYEGGLHID